MVSSCSTLKTMIRSLDFILRSQKLLGCFRQAYDVTSPLAQTVKRLPTMRETRVRSLGQEDLLEKEWQPTPVFLPGESHGQRSLAGYRKELDTTEQLNQHKSHAKMNTVALF